ncbi:MAG: bifunctional precorrin-2 dehydrogenase/sirohydrochlorin ferrochelatase [Nitrososphaerota archaeon]|jgi:precorrin-2 dehydrogenase/sirohydrochlorin ferrochelatase|nr:bifunctional precorrin-2 dehydrogenase/sirohydrochlorin ferrochelatase [Nitrososphaerota archaeon]
MLVDLNTEAGRVVVLGGGKEAEFRVKSLLEQGARVSVIAERFIPSLTNLGPRKVRLVKVGHREYFRIIKAIKPAFVISTIRDRGFNAQLVKLARAEGRLVNVLDAVAMGDFTMPAVAVVGDIKIAVATGGLSPAMAKLIKERLAKAITSEDILQVQLQGLIKEAIKAHVPNPVERRKLIYRIIRSKKISHLLKCNAFNEAVLYANKLIGDVVQCKQSGEVNMGEG